MVKRVRVLFGIAAGMCLLFSMFFSNSKLVCANNPGRFEETTCASTRCELKDGNLIAIFENMVADDEGHYVLNATDEYRYSVLVDNTYWYKVESEGDNVVPNHGILAILFNRQSAGNIWDDAFTSGMGWGYDGHTAESFQVYASVSATKQEHVWDLNYDKPPTCTEAGIIHCSICGYKRSVPPLNHIWDSGRVETAPTVYSEGVMTYTCNRDGTHRMSVSLPRQRFRIFLGDQRIMLIGMGDKKFYNVYVGDKSLIE